MFLLCLNILIWFFFIFNEEIKAEHNNINILGLSKRIQNGDASTKSKPHGNNKYYFSSAQPKYFFSGLANEPKKSIFAQL